MPKSKARPVLLTIALRQYLLPDDRHVAAIVQAFRDARLVFRDVRYDRDNPRVELHHASEPYGYGDELTVEVAYLTDRVRIVEVAPSEEAKSARAKALPAPRQLALEC